MPVANETALVLKHHIIDSVYLEREVKVDIYQPVNSIPGKHRHLLLVNDGQDLVTMNFRGILEPLVASESLKPLVVVGIHCGPQRRQEYGTYSTTDYAGRGAKAGVYRQFIFKELLHHIYLQEGPEWASVSYAGFSLGALTALDTVWDCPELFSIAGIFSGSMWWRSKSDADADFDENKDRIMQQLIRKGKRHPGQRFYFTTGSLDETADRNANGVIDSIDDTQAMISELKTKGYSDADIRYINFEDGRHDVPTWARAFPDFLVWGWGRENGQ